MVISNYNLKSFFPFFPLLYSYDNIKLYCEDVVSLDNMSVMRSGRKNTRLMIQDLDQMEKQAEEAGSQQEVGRHQNE